MEGAEPAPVLARFVQLDRTVLPDQVDQVYSCFYVIDDRNLSVQFFSIFSIRRFCILAKIFRGTYRGGDLMKRK